MKIIKSYSKTGGTLLAALTVALAVCAVSCNTDKIYEEEQYKNLVYLLSGSENVYTESYTLNETESVRYFSIGVGGSLSNPEEITVTLEPDRVLLDQYNKSNFDIKVASYAKVLPADRYEIASYTVTIPANNADQYVKVPVKVKPLGLSPDSIYFIPLAIKSVSRYGVNETKYNLLYRVTIENDYAKQKTTTYYTKKGSVKNQSNNSETTLSGSKIVQPLTEDKVRFFVGNYSQGQTTTIADIERYAVTVQIKSDNALEFASYGTIDVEKLSADNYNIYVEELQGTKTYRRLYLYYRYRIRNTDGTYGTWMEVKETLTRVEED
ncbi:MAG: DUF1735 domain-containing protein [Dysgonamonadaceae bacterium]|jgi:hypothetical protein|nr:DUF1735 domain-containing protein [Dysgonamonadaceae bacterium]